MAVQCAVCGEELVWAMGWWHDDRTFDRDHKAKFAERPADLDEDMPQTPVQRSEESPPTSPVDLEHQPDLMTVLRCKDGVAIQRVPGGWVRIGGRAVLSWQQAQEFAPFKVLS